MSRIINTVGTILAIVAAVACAEVSKEEPISVKVPAGSKMVLAIGDKGEILAALGVNEQAEVEQAAKCTLCTPELIAEYGDDPRCSKLREAKKAGPDGLPICSATTGGVLNKVVPLQLMLAHQNPDCLLVIEQFGHIVYAYPPGCAHP